MQVHFEKIKKLGYAMNEAYKVLRTNISFCGEDVRTIMITSSVENEGKTYVAFNLANAFAQDEKKVLFIDGDIRKSILLTWLGVDKETVGLSHYLSGKADMENIIYESDIPGLDIIFTGPSAPNPAELLGKEKFSRLLEQKRAEYDYIIIDCPPLGTVIDAAIVAAHCDGAVFVVESGALSYHLIQHVKCQLEKSGCRILGTVLNKVDVFEKGYKYGRYYSRYYKKGYYRRPYTGEYRNTETREI